MITLTTPGPTATVADWQTWWDAFSPVSTLSETEAFFYALGQGDRTVSGVGTPFAERIALAADATPATADSPAHVDPAKLADICAVIAGEHVDEIATVLLSVHRAQNAARDAFDAAIAHLNAPAPVVVPVVETPPPIALEPSVPVATPEPVPAAVVAEAPAPAPIAATQPTPSVGEHVVAANATHRNILQSLLDRIERGYEVTKADILAEIHKL